MTVLMGGPGSTGSSLLRTILNRHSDIFAGAELNFFNKEQFFEDWADSREKLLRNRKYPRIATKGWFPYSGHNLLHPDYGWTKEALHSLLIDSKSLVDFTRDFFDLPLKNFSANRWIEKTPSNAYSFKNFLELFPEGQVIHTTRNPLDSVASLVRRGMTPVFAAGLWVYNSATAMRVEKSSRYLLLKYEDLVLSPAAQLSKVCDFLDITDDFRILEPPQQISGSSIATWNHQREKRIGTSAIGGFARAEINVQQEIVTALSLFRIQASHLENRQLSYRNCLEVCTKLGYEFEPKIYPEYRPKIIRDLLVDLLRRSLRFNPTGWWNYPGTIS